MINCAKLFSLSGLISIFLLTGCATYYQKNLAFQEHFIKGEFNEANKELDKNKKSSKNNNRLLYFLQKGVVLQLLNRYEESNEFFEEAYYFTEDYRKNYSLEAASLLTNPTVTPYTGEDHELVLLHYYKALNYLRMSQFEEALVECRRINIKLNELNDRYSTKKNRYKQDAFALNLMGIVYEASGDVNNAFIAYRNAYETYTEDYKVHFNTNVPKQLKIDLLRTAYLNGFMTELEEFEREFGLKHVQNEQEGGELVFFWHNGLGPVKDEWSINFFILRGEGGIVYFVNEEMGLSFPFLLPSNKQGSNGLGDLKFIRVAFPKYLERKPYYQKGELIAGNRHYELELAENINDIAFKTLEDRMLRELANSLLRLALKQTLEETVRTQNENIGTLLSIVNAATEKADTRNWQTLPHSISYARVPLKTGVNQLKLNIYSSTKNVESEAFFEFNVEDTRTLFYIHNNIDSFPIGVK